MDREARTGPRPGLGARVQGTLSMGLRVDTCLGAAWPLAQSYRVLSQEPFPPCWAGPCSPRAGGSQLLVPDWPQFGGLSWLPRGEHPCGSLCSARCCGAEMESLPPNECIDGTG